MGQAPQIIAPEGRQTLAHSVSYGASMSHEISPGGATEKSDWLSVAPPGLIFTLRPIHTACAVGYRLSPLRGWGIGRWGRAAPVASLDLPVSGHKKAPTK